MRKVILSVLGAVVLTSCGVKAASDTEANTNTYKYFEDAMSEDLKVKYDEYRSNLAKIEQEKAHKRTVSMAQKKAAEKSEFETFEVTAYTAWEESTDKTPDDPNFGITASGEKVKENYTAACPKYLPFGTELYIPYFDNTYVCTDRGGAIKGKKLDIYMKELKDALEFGRRKLEVMIIEADKEVKN